MIHLIQVLKRDLPDMYNVAWIDLCQAAFIKNKIYSLDHISEIYQTKVYETEDKVVVIINASKRLQKAGVAEAEGLGN